MNTHIITCLTTLLAGSSALAAANTQGHLPLTAVDLMKLPGPDYAQLEFEDAQQANTNGPARMAVPNIVNVKMDTQGSWEHLGNGQMMWRIRVLSPGAAHINCGFEQLHLPPSAVMRMYALDRRSAIRPINAQTPLANGQYWSPVIEGDEIIIEFTVDQDERAALVQGVTLSAINEGYRGFRGSTDPPSHTSESCNIDVECPQGDNWTCEISSVGVYTVNGTWTCSGAMINNTAEDGTPYFLTAHHCEVTEDNASSVVVYWNYENSTCRTPGSSDSGAAGDGTLDQYTSGSTLLNSEDFNTTDHALLQLTSTPDASWNVTYAGWSRNQSLPSIGAGIHHPNTAEKRISIPSQVTNDPDYSDTYWEVVWADGVTQPGSSGSPLFNGEGQIIGQLCCGNSYCNAQTDPDWYGKTLDYSWNSIKDWLDPTSSNTQTLDSLCSTTPPDPTGACCIDDACSVTTEVGCGGTWFGADSTCADDLCGPSSDACEYDHDEDGKVGVVDLMLLLKNWGDCP